MTDFSLASAIEPDGERRWRAHLPEDWTQGRTTFGGLVAALGAQAAVAVAGPGRPLRTLDVAFVAPLLPGPAVIEAEVLGAGRSTSQVQVSIFSPDGGLATRLIAVLAAARPSGVRVAPPPADLEAGDPGGQGVELPYLPGLTPAFTQHVEFRWCSPALPFTSAGPEDALIDGWVRHRTAAEGLPALVGLLDAWPPAVLPMYAAPAPASSVRWAIHLTGAEQPPGESRPGSAWAGKDWVWTQIRTVQAGDGYASTCASAYDADGRLLAWSEQLIAIYDQRSR